MKVKMPRWSVLASSVIALSLVGAPAMAAEPSADDPVATVNTLLDTIIAKDFTGLGPLVCESKRDELLANFDLSQGMGEGMPPGVDLQALIDSLILATPDRVVTLVSNDGAVALVDVTATMTISMEEEGAKAFIAQVLEGQGMEVTDEMIAMLLPQLMAEFESGQDMSQEGVEVILENGVWVVCEDLGDGADASPAPSGEPMASPEASPAM